MSWSSKEFYDLVGKRLFQSIKVKLIGILAYKYNFNARATFFLSREATPEFKLFENLIFLIQKSTFLF